MSVRVDITQRPRYHARLAGGAPRLALYVLVGVLSLAGLGSIVRGHKTINEKFISNGSTVDLSAAEYATEFARAYLAYSAQSSEAHTQALSRFANNAIASEAGMSPQGGSETVLWAEPVQEQRPPSGGEIVTVAVQTSTVSMPQYLAVPVARNGGALAIASYPSFVGPPAVDAEYSAPEQTAVSAPGLTAMVTRVVTNYLSDNSQNLQADLVPGAEVSLPTVALVVQRVNSVTWARQGETVEVQLNAQDSTHSTFSLTYLIGVTQQERWYATSIEVNPTSST